MEYLMVHWQNKNLKMSYKKKNSVLKIKILQMIFWAVGEALKLQGQNKI